MQRRQADQIWVYDATTGIITYRDRPGVVATSPSGDGYLLLRKNGRSFKSHRIAWLLHYGDMPEQDVDHINGNRNDNRISNLRAVSRSINMRNARRPSTNTSGVVGVHWDKSRNRWRSMIRVDQKLRHIGLYNDFEAAVAARKAAEQAHGFHPNHGRI